MHSITKVADVTWLAMDTLHRESGFDAEQEVFLFSVGVEFPSAASGYVCLCQLTLAK